MLTYVKKYYTQKEETDPSMSQEIRKVIRILVLVILRLFIIIKDPIRAYEPAEPPTPTENGFNTEQINEVVSTPLK